MSNKDERVASKHLQEYEYFLDRDVNRNKLLLDAILKVEKTEAQKQGQEAVVDPELEAMRKHPYDICKPDETLREAMTEKRMSEETRSWLKRQSISIRAKDWLSSNKETSDSPDSRTDEPEDDAKEEIKEEEEEESQDDATPAASTSISRVLKAKPKKKVCRKSQGSATSSKDDDKGTSSRTGRK